MTYPPPPGTPDPYNTPPEPTPQDPFAAQPTNPYAQQPVSPPTPPPPLPPSSAPPYGAPYGQQPYGTQPYGTQPYGGYQATPPQNSMALTAMILALVGLAVPITAPVGAILGHVAMKQIKQSGESGEGMAKTGIIAGWIITAFWVICCLGYFGFVAAMIGSTGGFQ